MAKIVIIAAMALRAANAVRLNFDSYPNPAVAGLGRYMIYNLGFWIADFGLMESLRSIILNGPFDTKAHDRRNSFNPKSKFQYLKSIYPTTPTIHHSIFLFLWFYVNHGPGVDPGNHPAHGLHVAFPFVDPNRIDDVGS